MQHIDTLIIGAGQAGIAMSHALTRRGCPHLVVERRRVAERWRSERWDGLRFQFPNWSVQLPDFPFRHSDPDGFASAGEIVDYVTAYASFVKAPVQCGVEVKRLRRRDGGGLIAETLDRPIHAANVVVATGPYQRPVVPPLSVAPHFLALHASRYREPGQLPAGAVLIVGSGASGAQIAEELLRAGRRVFLSVGRHRRMPRRYRGSDLVAWLSRLGLDQTPASQRGPDQTLPLITGAYGGHTVDFRRFAAQGITLLGRLASVHDGVMTIRPDLTETLAYGDAAYNAFLDRVDAHVEHHKLDVPAEAQARIAERDPPCLVEPILRLDLRAEGISTILWATGYTFDFGWIDAPVLDARGAPVHDRGVTSVPGLYFLGLPWLSKMNSSFLSGVGDDAMYLATQIFNEGATVSYP